MLLLDYIKNIPMLTRLFYSLEFSLPTFIYGIFKNQVSHFEVKPLNKFSDILISLRSIILDDMKSKEMSPRDILEIGNVLSIYAITSSLIEEREVSEKRIDKEWSSRFYDCSKMSSNDKEQQRWAKVLTKELLNPGVIFKRTLNILSNAEEMEIDWFVDFLQFTLDDSYVPSFVIDNNYFQFHQFQSLIDSGFLNATLAGVNYKSKDVIKTKAGDILIDAKEGKASIEAYTLTDAGLQLCDLGDKKAPHSYYEKVKGHFELSANTTVDISGLSV